MPRPSIFSLMAARQVQVRFQGSGRRFQLRSPDLNRFVVSGVVPTGKELGRGSYGSVEEMRIPGAVCAAKKLHANLLLFGTDIQVEKWVSQFVSECEIMAALRHPNIVQFLGICYLTGSELPVLLLEKLFTCLHGFLESKPNIPLDGKHALLTGIISGLVYLHSRSPVVIHRDFTARNILLDANCTPKITDMGMAKMVNIRPGKLAATMTNAPGNINYMPPEAMGEGSKYTSAIDIFSFGHVALFTLTEIFPEELKPSSYYDSKSLRLLARSEIERREHYLARLYSELGRNHSLVQLIHQCLEYLPEHRPTAMRVLSQLEKIQPQLPQTNWRKTKIELLQTINYQARCFSSLEMQATALRCSIADKQKEVDLLTTTLSKKECSTKMLIEQRLVQRLKEVPAEKMEGIMKVITSSQVDQNFKINLLLLSDCGLQTREAAAAVITLVEEIEHRRSKLSRSPSYSLQCYIETIKSHSNIDAAMQFFIKYCDICTMEYPIFELVSMPGCIHSMCMACFKTHFTRVIKLKQRSAHYFVCAICEEPNMSNMDIARGPYAKLFLQLVKDNLDEECFKICSAKLDAVNQRDMEDIKKVITNKEFDNDFHLHFLKAECNITISQAIIVLQLLTDVEGGQDSAEYPLQYYIEAAKDHGDIEKARKFFIKECLLCLLEYPVQEFVAMPGCNHTVCKDCFRGNFTPVIKEKEVKYFTCPCGEPNMANQDITEGFYFQQFLHLVKQHLDKEVYKLCDEKINEFSLLKDHNFIWCANTEPPPAKCLPDP